MAELLNVRCSKGRLIITDELIIVERLGKSETMERAAFTGLDMKLSLWLVISAYTVVFHGKGSERLSAGMVYGKQAKAIKALLTGRE